MSGDQVARDAVLEELARVLASTSFQGADRSSALLSYLVAKSLARTPAKPARLKEYTVGVEALGRGVEFDPRTDPIVRAEASRLRGRLERYYAADGLADAVVIELPKGTYLPRFRAGSPAASPAPQPSRRRPLAWIALGSLATLAAFGVGAWIARPRNPTVRASVPPPMHLEVQLQSGGKIGSEVGTDVVLAPDGSRVAFVAQDSAGVAHLRVRRFDGSAAVELPGTNGARGPFWSPDGEWIGYWAGGELRKIAIDGGSPIVLCRATDLLGATWGEDGTIIAALDATNELWRVSAAGGAPVPVVDLGAGGAAPRWPQLVPGTRAVIFTALTPAGADRASIEAVSLVDGRRHVLVHGGTFGRYVAPGYITYVNQGTLYAVRFDAEHLDTRGAPVPIESDIAYSGTFGYAQLSYSTNGLAAYRRAPAGGELTVALLDSAGRATPLLDAPGRYSWPALSPDGSRLALSVVEGGVPGVSLFTRLDAHPARAAWRAPGYWDAMWTSDGRFLVAGGEHGIALLSATNGEVRALVKRGDVSVPWSFAPGDTALAFASMNAATAFDIWTVPLQTLAATPHAGTPAPLLRSRFYETYPAISPDGHWLAYASNESGSWEVYVRSLVDSAVKVRVSRDGGRVARWSRTSRRLYFGTDDQRIMVVSFTTAGGRFIAGTPREWVPVRLADTGVLPNFDLGPDDSHIVALLPAASADSARSAGQVTLISDFADELRRRLQ
jgi:serine/threonine-protein kinase